MTTNLILVDGPNWFRRRASNITYGTPIRSCFYELHNKQCPVVCIWDGFNSLGARRALYPDYKVKRKPAEQSIYDSQKLLKTLLGFSKVIQIEVPNFEGDDVIAHVVQRWQHSLPKQSIFIESNDLDLRQLDCPMARTEYPEKPHWIQLYKTLVGDSSDNIPGCAGFGEKTWESLTEDNKMQLDHFISSNAPYNKEDIIKAFEEFLPIRILNQFLLPETREKLKLFYKVVGFIGIPDKLVDENIKVGLNIADEAEKIMKEFML